MTTPTPHPTSLCGRCEHVRLITSGKGSVFLLCEASAANAGIPKYPPQPVARCPAFEPKQDDATA